MSQAQIGCFDGSCIWKRPNGMCTNGGCSCERDLIRALRELGYDTSAIYRFRVVIRQTRDEVANGEVAK